MATTTQIKARLEALMLLAPGSLELLDRYADPNTPLTASQVPGFFVGRAGRAEHENTAGYELFTTRRWLIWVVAAEYLDDLSDTKEAIDDAAEALLDDIIWYLRKHVCLGLDGTDNALSGVQGISLKDDGVKEYQRATKRYAALPIMVDIASIRSS